MFTKVANLPHRAARYLEAGSGRALVLLHAFPLTADQWLPQLHRVPRGWRLVAPDLRGFRGGGDPPGGLTIDEYADDVLVLMSHLEIDRAVVCGLSMGGYVALSMIARAPGRVAGLVLANTRASADTPEARASRDAMIATAGRDGVGAIATAMLPKLLGATTTREQPDLVDAVDRMIRDNTVGAVTAALGALRDRPDRTALLPQIACPTLIVAGGEDTVVPMADAEAMHHSITGSRLVVLPRAGHLSNLEDPRGFTAALVDPAHILAE
jgi:pimeloyl-ACP methyl ester carboxylesterase